jgi:hypothetical protein
MPAPVSWNTAPSGPWSAPDPMPFRPSMPFPSQWQSSDTNSWPQPLYARNAAPQSTSGTTAPTAAIDVSTLLPTDVPTSTAAPSPDSTTSQPAVPTTPASPVLESSSAATSYAIKSRRGS